MRIRALPVLVFVVCVLVLGACGGGADSTAPTARGPNPTSSDPGPNPTTFDPGPNPTGGGPVTESGTLQITAKCLTLQRAKGPLDLRFHGYQVKSKGLADDTGTVLAHDGDHIAVAGHEGKAKGPCGTSFDVESLVTVLPQ
ncbi:MAG: hypothetical protein QOI55_2289 [Actinomycetota bacterium]|jgi:hypothetical protein|nr:hypothetical protein [Actinomycetota bacterium]